MKLLQANQAADQLQNLIHFDTQDNGTSLHLTAGAFYRPTHPGSLDFGGSEYQPAQRELIKPEKESEDDDYGWWKLEHGTYLMQLNEQPAFSSEILAFIYPIPRLLETGCYFGSFALTDIGDEPLLIPLHVGDNNVNINENARVAGMSCLQV